jgi:hypothetical protein
MHWLFFGNLAIGLAQWLFFGLLVSIVPLFLNDLVADIVGSQKLGTAFRGDGRIVLTALGLVSASILRTYDVAALSRSMIKTVIIGSAFLIVIGAAVWYTALPLIAKLTPPVNIGDFSWVAWVLLGGAIVNGITSVVAVELAP